MALTGNLLRLEEGLVIIFYIIVLVAVFYHKPEGIKLNKNFTSSDTLFTASMIGLALFLAALAIFFGFLKIGSPLGFREALLSLLVMSLIMAPAEEIIFRGFLGGWISNHVGIIVTVFFTSIIFGLAHLPKGEELSLIAGIGGLFFSVIYINTSSIIYPMIAHALLGFLYFFFKG